MQFLKEYKISFLDFVNQENAKLALLLNLIEQRCGGVLLVGKKGTGKSTLLKAFKEILRLFKIPCVEVPMNVTEEAILGGTDIEETIKTGKRRFQKGLLSKANEGFLIIEDINLFSQDILSIIFEVQAKGENIVEREGFTLREPTNFQVIATMNPDEADFSSHFLDRFGICVIMDEIREKEKKAEIIKLNLDECFTPQGNQLFEKIWECKEFIKSIRISDEIKEFISELVLNEGITSHRADVFLYYVSKAYAAYLRQDTITKEHVTAVAPFVLNHRKRLFIEPESEEQEHEHENEQAHDNSNSSENEEERKQNMPLSKIENSIDKKSQSLPASGKEEIFPIGESFSVKRFIFKRDKILRHVTGRRTKTKTKGRGGRYIRSLLRQRPDIAIDATLRAAAPFQKLRGMKDRILIYDEDLRYKEKERKMSHTVIFVVDGSGSMGVEKRMIATKGAILSLLMDCYQKRDKVSMIVFRKDKAEIVLPPTSSVELAMKRLKEIPTGGKTPLGASFLETYKLIKRLKLKNPETRFLVFFITDGKANVSLSGKPVFKELQKMCLTLKEFSSTDFIVIDTEKKGIIKMDLALRIAQWLGAIYFLIEELRSEIIFSLVNLYKSKNRGC